MNFVDIVIRATDKTGEVLKKTLTGVTDVVNKVSNASATMNDFPIKMGMLFSAFTTGLNQAYAGMEKIRESFRTYTNHLDNVKKSQEDLNNYIKQETSLRANSVKQMELEQKVADELQKTREVGKKQSAIDASYKQAQSISREISKAEEDITAEKNKQLNLQNKLTEQQKRSAEYQKIAYPKAGTFTSTSDEEQKNAAAALKASNDLEKDLARQIAESTKKQIELNSEIKASNTILEDIVNKRIPAQRADQEKTAQEEITKNLLEATRKREEEATKIIKEEQDARYKSELEIINKEEKAKKELNDRIAADNKQADEEQKQRTEAALRKGLDQRIAANEAMKRSYFGGTKYESGPGMNQLFEGALAGGKGLHAEDQAQKRRERDMDRISARAIEKTFTGKRLTYQEQAALAYEQEKRKAAEKDKLQQESRDFLETIAGWNLVGPS